MSPRTWLNARKLSSDQKARSKRARKSAGTGRRILPIEPLEDRITPTISASSLLQSLGSDLSTVGGSYLSKLSNDATQLPVIGESIGQVASGVASTISQAATTLRNGGIVNAVQNAINTGNYTAIDKAIESLVPGASNVVVRNLDQTAGNIEITMDLEESVTTEFNFATGLPSLPFQINVPRNGVGPGNLTASFDYTNLDFGLQANEGSFWINNNGPSQVQLHLGTSILAGTQFTGDFGLFNVQASVLTDNGIGLSGDVVSNVTGTGLGNIGLTTPTFQNFVAQANLHLSGVIGSGSVNDADQNLSPVEQQLNVPHIETDFRLYWDLSGSDASADLADLGSQDPDVQFNHVQIGVGSAIGSVLKPILNLVQEVTDPIAPVLKLLDAPIPGLSDIGAGKVSVLRLASIINDEGAVPPGISQAIDLASDLLTSLDVIDSFNLSTDDDILLDVGNFDLTQNLQNQDLRTVASASTVQNALTGDLSSINFLGAAVTKIGDLISSQVPDGPIKVGLDNVVTELSKYTSPDDSIHLSFPLLEDPLNGALQLLFGQDVDLVSFDADLVTPPITNTVKLAIDPPFEFDLNNEVQLSAHIKVGYDTFGLREVAEGESASHLLDGLYIGAAQPLLSISAAGDVALVATTGPIGPYASGSVGLSGNFSIGVHNDGTGKLRVLTPEVEGQLFDVSGSLAVHAGFQIGGQVAGFQVSILNFPVYYHTFIDFSNVNTSNPFKPTYDPGPTGTTPSFGTSAQPTALTLDVAKYPGQPGQPDVVDVYRDGNALDVLVNNQLVQYFNPGPPAIPSTGITWTNGDPQATALTIVGSGKGGIYTIEGDLDINLQAGAGNNTLVINEQPSTENISNDNGASDTFSLTDHSLDQVRNSYGGFQTEDAHIEFQGLSSLKLITPSFLNTINVDSLPAFPVSIVTTKQVLPTASLLSILSIKPGVEWERSLCASSNTIIISADALSNGSQLSIDGNSGNDTVEIDGRIVGRGYAIQTGVLHKALVPTYLIDSESLIYERPMSARFGSSSLPTFSSAEVSFTGLRSLTLKGIDATTGGVIGRDYTLDSWSDSTTLNIQGGSGDDTFDIGNGNVDNVSGTLFPAAPHQH